MKINSNSLGQLFVHLISFLFYYFIYAYQAVHYEPPLVDIKILSGGKVCIKQISGLHKMFPISLGWGPVSR